MSLFSDIAGIFGGDQPDFSQAQFKPYSVTTPFGSTSTKGRNISANLSPELKALYDSYLSGAMGAMPSEEDLAFGQRISRTGQNLFDQYLGKVNEALNYDVDKETQDYYEKTLAMLQPERDMEASNLADILFKTGRTGAGVSMGEGYVNPEQYALLKARENANAGIFLNAQDRARAIRTENLDRILQGLNTSVSMFGTGASVAPSLFGGSQGIAGGAMNMATPLGQQIGYGLQAGQARANAGANIAQMEQQQYTNNLGFWGGLMSGVGPKLSGWSNPFIQTSATVTRS